MAAKCNKENCPRHILKELGYDYNPSTCSFNKDKKEGSICFNTHNKQFNWKEALKTVRY